MSIPSLTKREVHELHSFKCDIDLFLRLAAKEMRVTDISAFTLKSGESVLVWLADFNERIAAEGLKEIGVAA